MAFEGTSASHFGTLTPLALNPTWATYSIDGGSSVNFTLNGLSNLESPFILNALFFTTPTLPSAQHRLIMTYGGDTQHTPLVLGWLLVTNTTSVDIISGASSSSSSATSSSSSLSTSSPTATGSHPMPVAAIACGTVGGLVLALIALAFCYKRRRPDTHANYTSALPYPMSSVYNPVRNRSKGETQSGSLAAPSCGIERRVLNEVPTPSPTQGGAHPEPFLLRHEDSGIRLHPGASDPRQRIVELPPGYSPD